MWTNTEGWRARSAQHILLLPVFSGLTHPIRLAQEVPQYHLAPRVRQATPLIDFCGMDGYGFFFTTRNRRCVTPGNSLTLVLSCSSRRKTTGPSLLGRGRAD